MNEAIIAWTAFMAVVLTATSFLWGFLEGEESATRALTDSKEEDNG